MNKLFNLTLSGLVTGAIYSVMASGLVLTYTTSGIFNFAHGAIAFTVAYLYYQLISAGLSIVPALIISVFVFAPVLGLVLDRLLLRRLGTAPVYARIVGTIGLLIALPASVQWLVVDVGVKALGWDLVGNESIARGGSGPGLGPTPPHVFHIADGLALTSDQFAVFVVAAVAALGLWLVLRHTRAGLEMRAVVDRETLAGLRGVDAARTSAIAWVLTMVLAGLGGILIAPLFTLNDTIFTLIVLGSLAAVVLGGLRSLPITFAGGLLLGVVQNLVAGYADHLPAAIANLSGLRSSVPYVLVLVLGLIIGRDRTRRAGTVSDDRPPIDHRRGLSTRRRRLPWVLATIALVAYSFQWIDVSALKADAYGQTVIAQSLAMGIVLLSFVVVTGMGGMVSLAQATFATAGGFAAGWALARDWGIDLPLIATDGRLNFVWAIVIGVLTGAGVGALIALPATRLGAVYLAVWSLAAAFFCSLIPFAWKPIGHGQLGWTIRSPKLDVVGLNQLHHLVTRVDGPFDFSTPTDQILLFLVVFALGTLVVHRLGGSAFGRAMLAVRSSEVAARASGISADRTKVIIFAVSAGIAALGGVMLSLFSYAASNSTAPPYVGLFWLAMAVLFGIRRPGGALLAGFAFAAGPSILRWMASPLPGETITALVGSVYFVPILSGMGAIQLAQQPDGILALMGHRRLEQRRNRQRRARIAAAEVVLHFDDAPGRERVHPSGRSAAEPRPRTGAEVFELTGIVAGYGEVEVLHGVTLALTPGCVVALLGANGAGKSTLCSVAAGLVRPTEGAVTLAGVDRTAAPAFQRARSGLVLVPEARGVFPGLTVEENLAISLRSPEHRARAYERFPILGERRNQLAGLLSGGQQQMLGLAPALADPPAVLIADEPTLGLAPLAADEVIRAILELRDKGTAVLLVEEHAQNALRVADIVAFMELGTITWIGERCDVDQERLSAAYLG